MGVDASWPLQQAILSALRSDSRIAGLLGKDGIVESAGSAGTDPVKGPAIEWAGTLVRAWHSATFDGQDHEIFLLLRVPEGGPDIGELAAAVTALLHDADLPVPGHALISLELEQSETRPAEGGRGSLCRMAFRALTVSD